MGRAEPRASASGHTIALVMGIVFAAVMTAQKTPVSGPMLSFTATSANVGGAPDSIRIDLFRWSTDAERDQLVSAWNMTGAGAGAGRGGGRGAGRGAGRGGGAGRSGRSGAGADPAPDPDAVDAGRGGGTEEAPPTPESTLAKALKQATTVGYLWSSEVAGYAVRYAAKLTGADGADRIILITERRLGATNDLWKPAGTGAPNAYDFSVIELRVNAKGEGEGKASLIGKVMPDSAAKVVAPDYAGLPVIFKNLKRRHVEGE